MSAVDHLNGDQWVFPAAGASREERMANFGAWQQQPHIKRATEQRDARWARMSASGMSDTKIQASKSGSEFL